MLSTIKDQVDRFVYMGIDNFEEKKTNTIYNKELQERITSRQSHFGFPVGISSVYMNAGPNMAHVFGYWQMAKTKTRNDVLCRSKAELDIHMLRNVFRQG